MVLFCCSSCSVTNLLIKYCYNYVCLTTNIPKFNTVGDFKIPKQNQGIYPTSKKGDYRQYHFSNEFIFIFFHDRVAIFNKLRIAPWGFGLRPAYRVFEFQCHPLSQTSWVNAQSIY